MRRAFVALRCGLAMLYAGVCLTACSTAPRRAPRTYAQSTDSATASCGRNPAPCKPQVGEQFPVIPTDPAARPPPPLSGSQSAALNLAAVAKVVAVAIDASLEARIRQALSECADEARSQVMLKHFGDRGPTKAECDEKIVTAHGETITRAMQLGNEQHQVALACAQQRLNGIKPGGFSLSPHYRVDPSTGRAQHIPRDQVDALLNQGRGVELRGTIEPDVVIHTGNPHQVQAVFDFKFPCVNSGQAPQWRKYPPGHPCHPFDQKRMYEDALDTTPQMVIPRLGVL